MDCLERQKTSGPHEKVAASSNQFLREFRLEEAHRARIAFTILNQYSVYLENEKLEGHLFD